MLKKLKDAVMAVASGILLALSKNPFKPGV